VQARETELAKAWHDYFKSRSWIGRGAERAGDCRCSGSRVAG